jgi:uncharacterized membrane protein
MTDDQPSAAPRIVRTRPYGAGVLLGAGVMAAVDEIVFHQILAWHHFYDRDTSDIGLLSDGLLHAASLFALVGGFFLLLDARRRGALRIRVAGAGFLVGLGGFQLWDGLVDHKVLRVHQIRYGVDVLPYDIAWVAAGAVLLAAGGIATVLVVRAERRRSGRS